MVERVITWVIPIFADWGLLIVFLATFLETSAFLGLLVPGESVVILAGILSNQAFRESLGAPADLPVTIQQVIIVATLGAIAGDQAGYFIGRFGGRRLIVRKSRRLIGPERLHAAEAYYRKHGGKTIFLGRFTPVLRSLGAMVAGMSEMSYLRFTAWDFAGAAIWGTAIPLIGYEFGRYGRASIRAIDRVLKAPGYAILAAMAVVVLIYALRRRGRQEQTESSHPNGPEQTDDSHSGGMVQSDDDHPAGPSQSDDNHLGGPQEGLNSTDRSSG